MKICNRWYVLSVLTLVYMVNFIDRQLITILAPYIKSDLQISDAQLGLLYGTTFALFYGLFGIPLARLADSWNRVNTISLSVAFWSMMTAVSGMASNFSQLGLARVGVGVGEAGSGPAAASLMADYFSTEQRATAFSLYATGIYIGGGLSLILGGGIVAWWQGSFDGATGAPFGLAGWQAAFILVGMPGLLLAALVYLTIPEPARTGSSIGMPPETSGPFRRVLSEVASMFPPTSVLHLRRRGGVPSARINVLILIACIIAASAATLATDQLPGSSRRVIAVLGSVELTSNAIQWFTIAIGAYATVSWMQALRFKNPEAHRLIISSPCFVALTLCGAFIGIAMYSVNAFNFVYAVRYLGFGPEAGLRLGVIATIAGMIGSAMGGIWGDKLKLRHPAGRLYLLMFNFLLFGIATAVQYTTSSSAVFYAAFATSTFFLTSWSGLAIATGQDLLLPHTRGTGYAFQQLGCNIIALGLGPYCVGLISDATGDLRSAILTILITVPLVLGSLAFIARRISDVEASLALRAQPALAG